jgi:hypothetical protein
MTTSEHGRRPTEETKYERGTETKGTALISGASAGIGAIYADRLAKRSCISTSWSSSGNLPSRPSASG